MALRGDDTPIMDDKDNEAHNDDLGQDMREQLGLDNQEDDDSY